MVLVHIYRHRTDEQGLPIVKTIHVQSTTGTLPEQRGLSLYRWAMYIRLQLGITERKNNGREARSIAEKFEKISKYFSKN